MPDSKAQGDPGLRPKTATPVHERLLLDEWLFLAYIAIVSITRFNVLYRGFALPAADFLFVFVAIGHVALIASRRRRIRWCGFHLFAAAYLAAMLLSALQSEAPRHSLLKWTGECYLVGTALIAFNVITSEASLRRATLAWLGGAAVNVGFGLAATVAFYTNAPQTAKLLGTSGFGSLPAGNYARVSGLFSLPNAACTFYIITVVLTMMAKDRGWLSGGLANGFLVATAITALLTLSPGLGGLVLAPCIVRWVDDRAGGRTTRARLALAAGIATAALSLLAALPELAALPHSLDPSPRVLIWRQAIHNVQVHPFFGRGIGLDAVNVTYASPNGHVHRLTDGHNAILNIAAEGGLITTVAFVALMIYLLRGIPWSGRKSLQRIAMFLGVALICGFLYPDLTGSFEDTRHEWVLIGMLLSARELARIEDGSSKLEAPLLN